MNAWAVSVWLAIVASGTGRAAELSPSGPGLAVVVPRCSTDPADECWDNARHLRHFRAASGLHAEPVQADVALAWSREGLLVRVDSLPDGAAVEVGLGARPGEVSIAKMEPLRVSEPGIAVLVPTRALKPGTLRRGVVNVVLPDGAGGVALPWSPGGPPLPGHHPRLLFTEEAGPGLPVTLSTDGEKWVFEAVGGVEARIAHLRPPIRVAGRGVPEPWSASGSGRVETPAPPDWGMHEVVGIWNDTKGRAVDMVARRVWSEPPGPVGVSREAPFFPPAKTFSNDGASYTLPDAPSVCFDPELEAVAELWMRELQRMTGRVVTTSDACDLRLSVDAEVPAQGFRIVVGRHGVDVRARDRLGATFGTMALVDALGPDAETSTMTVEDWPTIAERPLYHSMNLPNRPDLTVEDYIRFIERVVTRGRYSHLHLFFPSGMPSDAVPGLARRGSWSADEIGRLRDVCERLGIVLIPGVNAPGHAEWLTRVRPDLMEDVNPSLLDVRHPDTQSVLSAYYEEVWAAFGRPNAIHIGHDESLWLSHRWFGDEWNPRTSSTPRALLFADDLRFHLAWCKARGITPYIWTDMLVDGWNGGRDGVADALALLTDQERAMLRAMAWAPLGEPFTALTERWGIPVLRVHTGYLDWKRAGLSEQLDQVAGEGLALFVPAPWAAFGPSPGSRSLQYHLPTIVLAGATAWAPDLEPQAHIDPTLAALAGHPVIRPGYRSIPHRRSLPLISEGVRPGTDVPQVAWSRQLQSDGIVYEVDPRIARLETPAVFPMKRPRAAAGVSVLVAAMPTHAAEAKLLRSVNASASPDDQAVGWVVIEYVDGSETRRPLELGEDLYTLESGPRANAQWRAADVVPMASQHVERLHPEGRDLRLYRIDVPTDDGALEVQRVRVDATRDGVPLMVGAAVALLP